MTNYVQNSLNSPISSSFDFSTDDSLLVGKNGSIVLSGETSVLGAEPNATGIDITVQGLIDVASFNLGALSSLVIGLSGSLIAHGRLGQNNLVVGGTLGQSLVNNQGQITVLHNAGLSMSGGNNQVINSGTIFGDQIAVVLGSDFSGSDALTNTGTIQSNLYEAVGMIGGLGYIDNSGTISSVTGAAVFASGEFDGRFSTATSQQVTNSGLLASQDSVGISVIMLEAASTFTLFNSGTVRGGTGAFSGRNETDRIFNTGILDGGLTLGSGNDRLDTNDGTIIGDVYLGSGNDTFLGLGASVRGSIFGGGGSDVYRTDDALLDIHEQANGLGIDTVYAAVSFHLATGLERLHLVGTGDFNGFGNAGANILTGNSGNNRLVGLEGRDRISGAVGNDLILGGSQGDRLNGGNGDDSLNGNPGDDALFGGDGNDVLIGGQGLDRLAGASGGDRFVFATLNQTGATKLSADIITDFGPGDLINLQAIDANQINSTPNDTFKFIGTGAFSHVAGQLRFLHSNGNTFVAMDVDGDSSADAVIRLDGLLALDAGDFVL